MDGAERGVRDELFKRRFYAAMQCIQACVGATKGRAGMRTIVEIATTFQQEGHVHDVN